MILQSKEFVRITHPKTGIVVEVDTRPYRTDKDAHSLAMKVIKSKLAYLQEQEECLVDLIARLESDSASTRLPDNISEDEFLDMISPHDRETYRDEKDY
jgi:protein subunit release factor B